MTIITCPPLPPVDQVHDRMPLIIEADDRARWLDPEANVTSLFEPHPSFFVATPVSTYVNSPKNDDPKCIEPGTLEQGTLF